MARIEACYDLASSFQQEFTQPGLQRHQELLRQLAERVEPEQWPMALLTMPATEWASIGNAMQASFMLCVTMRHCQRPDLTVLCHRHIVCCSLITEALVCSLHRKHHV